MKWVSALLSPYRNAIALVTKEDQEMQIDELKERILALPASLQEALERQAKAYIAVAHLEAQITKLEAEIERQEDQDNDLDNDESDSLEDNLEFARLEAKVERLKLKVSETEDRAEMAFRALGKTTDAQVKAAVGSNLDVIAAKENLQDAKEWF
jgi:predicted RNase H-like nuclease (RuvC/YqgF family)